MAKKRLLVDMDGTLARFHDQANYLERMFEKDFFRELEPFANMVEGVRQFMQDHPDVEVFIVSARVIGEPPYCEVEKNAWLDRYLPEIDREHRIFTDIGHSKVEYLPGGATKDDYLLDDYNKGLNLFMYDGGSAIKCHNNINQRGLGAYGGEKGQLWTGAMVHVDDRPEMISAELAQSMGLSYDRRKVFNTYAAYEPVFQNWSQEKKDAFIAPEREAAEGSLLDQIRFYSFDPHFKNLSFPGMAPGEKINIPYHKAQAICMNEFGTATWTACCAIPVAPSVKPCTTRWTMRVRPLLGSCIIWIPAARSDTQCSITICPPCRRRSTTPATAAAPLMCSGLLSRPRNP